MGDDAVSGFLHLPMPKDLAENRLYASLPSKTYVNSRWSDITRGSDGWVYRDGSPVSWFNWWADGKFTEEYSPENVETAVEISEDGTWEDTEPRYGRQITCSYFLPAGSETICPWLKDFEDGQ